jgi:hypothetical protein
MAAGPLNETIAETRRIIDRIAQQYSRANVGSSAQVSAAQINAAIVAFVRALPRSFSIVVPGTHDDGLTYDALIGILASQGRDFLLVTVQLTQYVRAQLTRVFAGSKTLPTLAQLRRAAAPAILDHIEERFSKRGNADVLMTPLSRPYAAWKARTGRGGQPIGVLTGDLRAAFSRKAQVKWKGGSL